MSKIKQATKKTGRARKEQIVAELVEKFDKASGLIFSDYKGLTHKQLESLKKELKQLDSTIVIAKNSLLKLSLGKSKNFADYKDNQGLDLPTATLFIQGDMFEPLKKIQKAIKDFGLPKIKFAVLEGSLMDEAQVLKIASLPGRETLLAQLVGTLNSPISGLVQTLNGTIQKFVMTLDAVAKAKPADSNQTTASSDADGSDQTESSSQNAVVNEPQIEPAQPANEPAEQPPAPEVTDELADPTSDAKPQEEKTEGGEEKANS